ncbi:Type II secretory pathway ATPase GspE/PulE or T4P pilus assembly pathway ATPase PilB [Roseateles sp. YR242]|uniref:GspE/PulE family protein n=1 Tax=Roseateles sp. YR242 TaxID=1855305 RepID=UPI0008BB02DD|nr:ATPase, T2SS/T4P/T4SS family [Roseateles sp. YR242]SEK64525.1 Type II secretory pathway ATPase GspE/PulE or T4P pilus assembly pathway ATPase PilB [Roseateles sp. YR242]
MNAPASLRDMARADPMPVEVLSASGLLAAGEEERKFVCLLSDGQLLIAQGQAMNAYVLSYQARLRHLGHACRIVSVPIEVIGRHYRGASRAQFDPEHTRMQQDAKDLLTAACSAQASDIHIRVKQLGTEVYFRIHNDLERIGGHTREYGARLLATLYGAMASVSDNAYKPTERQDAAIADRDKLPEQLIGVRIATTPTSEGWLMVLRLLYNDAGETLDLCRLGFTPAQASVLQTLREQPTGMNLISGPAGSGKSTTLQRVLLGQLAQQEGRLHVITVEDPVEYPIAGAVQTPLVNAASEEDRARLFSAAIVNAMRLDPDTIMIGEIRDMASARSALRAAMTGHQVWSSVHANSAVGIVDRLEDIGLPLRMVADLSIITGLISQRLVKRLCPSCCQPLGSDLARQTPSPELQERLHATIGQDLTAVRVVGTGCMACGGRGTIGRTVLAEVIAPDERFCALLRAGDKSAAIRHWRDAMGGLTMVEHAIAKVREGIVDPAMAERAVGRLAPSMYVQEVDLAI